MEGAILVVRLMMAHKFKQENSYSCERSRYITHSVYVNKLDSMAEAEWKIWLKWRLESY